MKRPYDNSQRKKQMNKTRERILEGLIRTTARGVAALSIPAVAQEAGISIPTVYRHFRTKADLLAALGPYVASKVGIDMSQPAPRSPEELASMVREMYIRSDGLDETLKAAMVSELGSELRQMAHPERLKIIEGALQSASTHLSEPDRIRLRNVILVLSSSAVMRAFNEYLDLSGEEAADAVTWAITTLARAAAGEFLTTDARRQGEP